MVLSKEVMTKTVRNSLRIGLAIGTADPMVVENSKDCIANSNSSGLGVVVDFHAVAYVLTSS